VLSPFDRIVRTLEANGARCPDGVIAQGRQKFILRGGHPVIVERLRNDGVEVYAVAVDTNDLEYLQRWITDKSSETTGPVKGKFFTIPMGTEKAVCQAGCPQDLYWVRTEKSSLLVDPNVPGGLYPTRALAGKGIAHFATCSSPERFRKGHRP
jgi:hypothetical protein